MNKAERNYPAHKLEFLALKWAVTDKLRYYLFGDSFKVCTDNNPLTYVFTTAKLDAIWHRWVAELANFNFTIEYRAGKSNVAADALSRIQWPESLGEMSTESVSAVLMAAALDDVSVAEVL